MNKSQQERVISADKEGQQGLLLDSVSLLMPSAAGYFAVQAADKVVTSMVEKAHDWETKQIQGSLEPITQQAKQHHIEIFNVLRQQQDKLTQIDQTLKNQNTKLDQSCADQKAQIEALKKQLEPPQEDCSCNMGCCTCTITKCKCGCSIQ